MYKMLMIAITVMAMANDTNHAKAEEFNASAQIKTYSEIVFANYNDAFKDGVVLQQAVAKLLDAPSAESLKSAKNAWLVSRNSYGQTEAFRFYEGPIDFVNEDEGTEGPEGRLNAWPLNEAYIDYVKGNDSAGIVNNGSYAITEKSIASKNQAEDEADVSTGYHAIEFLLWGQDFSTEGPGTRPVSDFVTGSNSNERRRSYLKSVTDLLVSDLAFLRNSWEPNKENYAADFVKRDTKTSIGYILTSLATLSGFELAAERMATALDSGDQEDEHSCFSDNTHNDFIYNAKGIKNIYLGQYGNISGASIHSLIKMKDSELANKIANQIEKTQRAIAAIPYPIDSKVLASAKGSNARVLMEKAITSLQKQADLFKSAGNILGIKVEIASE